MPHENRFNVCEFVCVGSPMVLVELIVKKHTHLETYQLIRSTLSYLRLTIIPQERGYIISYVLED